MTRHIENSDRGITINKSLAWTMASALVAGGIWVGVQITEAQYGINTLQERQVEDRRDIRTNARRIGDLTSSNARIEQRLDTIETYTKGTQSDVQEVLRYLRGPQP